MRPITSAAKRTFMSLSEKKSNTKKEIAPIMQEITEATYQGEIFFFLNTK